MFYTPQQRRQETGNRILSLFFAENKSLKTRILSTGFGFPTIVGLFERDGSMLPRQAP